MQTILLYLHQEKTAVVAEKLNHDLTTLGNFFDESSPVANFKKSTVEFLPCGSHQRLSKNTTVDIIMNGEKISETKSYKYLGVTFDKNVNLQSYFDNLHKK